MADLAVSDEPNGSVFAFLDESYDPLVAAAAVVVEASDASSLNDEIVAAYERISGWHNMRGLPSFELFRREGFHATSNPPEVQIDFVNLLAGSTKFKSLIVYSDRSRRPDLSDKQRLMIVFDRLVRDVVRAYQQRPKVVLCFESAQEMDNYVERVVIRAVDSLGRATPDVDIRFGPKRDPDLLAVPDYVLHVFGRWFAKQDPGAQMVDPRDHASRSFRAILGSVSMARSLDDATVVRRTLR